MNTVSEMVSSVSERNGFPAVVLATDPASTTAPRDPNMMASTFEPPGSFRFESNAPR